MKQEENFFTAFSRLLSERLAKITMDQNRKLDASTCRSIFVTIYEVVHQISKEGELYLSNEGLNYVAQQFYDGLLINGNQELDPNIFDKRAKLENISSKDLVSVLALFGGTDFRFDVIQELKGR